MKEVKIIASTYGVREVRHVAIQQLRVIQYLSVPCLPSLLSILCPIFRPRLHPFFSLPSLFFSISLFSKEPFNSPTCQVFIASDDPTALAKATQDEDLLVSFVPLDRSMLQVTSRFSHVRVTGPSLKMHCYCPAQKGPGTERAWYRKGLVQKGPGAERAWCRKGLVQKGPGAERAWCRKGLEQKGPGAERAWSRRDVGRAMCLIMFTHFCAERLVCRGPDPWRVSGRF